MVAEVRPKCLLHKHEDLSSDSKDPHKGQELWNLNAKPWRQKTPEGGWSASLANGELLVQRDRISKENKPTKRWKATK